jgi:hypothetical protein
MQQKDSQSRLQATRIQQQGRRQRLSSRIVASAEPEDVAPGNIPVEDGQSSQCSSGSNGKEPQDLKPWGVGAVAASVAVLPLCSSGGDGNGKSASGGDGGDGGGNAPQEVFAIAEASDDDEGVSGWVPDQQPLCHSY